MIAGGNTVAGNPANVPADNSALSLSPEEFKQALSEDRLRIVFLVGQSQVGKSTLTCHLVGKDVASIGNGVDRCTDKPQQFALRYKDKIILFVDTPGLNDAETTDAEQMEKISTKLLSYDLVSTVLLCVNAKQANISASLAAVVKQMKKAFGDDFDKLLMMHMTKYTMVNPNGFSDDSVKGPVYKERATAVKACEELEKSCEVVVSQGLTYSDADPYRVSFDAVSSPPEVIQKMKPAQQKALKFRVELLEKLASATMYPTLAKRERDLARQILDKEREKLESAKEKRIGEEKITSENITRIMKEAGKGGGLAFLIELDARPMYVWSSSETLCCFERCVKQMDTFVRFGMHYWRDNIDIRAIEGAKLKLLDKNPSDNRLLLHWAAAIREPIDFNDCYIDSYYVGTDMDTKSFVWWDHRRLVINVKPKTSIADKEKEVSTAIIVLGEMIKPLEVGGTYANVDEDKHALQEALGSVSIQQPS